MDDRETVFAHVDQPAFEQMQIDHNISRIALFFVCFLTLAVFYFTLVNFSVAKLLPMQQIQQVTSALQTLNPTASRAPVGSARPVGQLGGTSIAAPSAEPSVPAAAPAPASTTPSPSAAPVPGKAYTVASGDTLTSIARKFNTNAQAIADANKMTVNAPLHVGDKLTIP